MANRVTAKTLNGGSSRRSGGRVVYHIDTAATLDSDDFTFHYNTPNLYRNAQYPGSGTDSEFVTVSATVIPRRMECVINMSANPITIDGNEFETGRWELSQHGGIDVEQAKGNIVITQSTGTPNCIIEFRS